MTKKNLLMSIFSVIILFEDASAQTNNTYTGNQSECPYLHPAADKTAASVPVVIDDFESAEVTYKKWSNPMESGTMKSSIDLSDSAQSGKKSAKISFTGTKSPGSWTNLQCKTTFPAGKNKITFWARAEKECTIKITSYQGAYHNEMEIFGKTITIGTTWKKYEVGISELTEIIFSHFSQDGGKASEKITKEKVTAVGFADTGSPAVFYLDNLMFE